MKTNPNDAVVPMVDEDTHKPWLLGLTKREYFAAMAMQGLVGYCAAEGHQVNITADTAVQFADALIASLNKCQDK